MNSVNSEKSVPTDPAIISLSNDSLPLVHLFSAYSANGKVSGKLEPIANTLVIAINPEKTEINEEEPVLLATNSVGVLYILNIDTLELRSPLHDFTEKRTFVLPPPDIVSFIKQSAQQKGSGGEKSSHWINEMLKHIDKTNTRTLKLVKQRHSDMRPPKHNEKEYSKWHNTANRDKPIYCYVVPKTRGLICVVNKEIPINLDEVTLYKNKSMQVGQSKRITWLSEIFGNFRIAIDIGTSKSLPKGMYSFKIPLMRERVDQSKNHWNNLITESDENGNYIYTIAEMARFGISNPAGEFDIISLDPISLEESMIVQYPPRSE